jgi:hypothetical protein
MNLVSVLNYVWFCEPVEIYLCFLKHWLFCVAIVQWQREWTVVLTMFFCVRNSYGTLNVLWQFCWVV